MEEWKAYPISASEIIDVLKSLRWGKAIRLFRKFVIKPEYSENPFNTFETLKIDDITYAFITAFCTKQLAVLKSYKSSSVELILDSVKEFPNSPYLNFFIGTLYNSKTYKKIENSSIYFKKFIETIENVEWNSIDIDTAIFTIIKNSLKTKDIATAEQFIEKAEKTCYTNPKNIKTIINLKNKCDKIKQIVENKIKEISDRINHTEADKQKLLNDIKSLSIFDGYINSGLDLLELFLNQPLSKDIQCEAEYLKGLIYFSSRNFNKAIICFKRSINLKSNFDLLLKSYLKLAHCYERIGDQKSAEFVFEGIMKLGIDKEQKALVFFFIANFFIQRIEKGKKEKLSAFYEKANFYLKSALSNTDDYALKKKIAIQYLSVSNIPIIHLIIRDILKRNEDSNDIWHEIVILSTEIFLEPQFQGTFWVLYCYNRDENNYKFSKGSSKNIPIEQKILYSFNEYYITKKISDTHETAYYPIRGIRGSIIAILCGEMIKTVTV